jgi:hypothetical protein
MVTRGTAMCGCFLKLFVRVTTSQKREGVMQDRAGPIRGHNCRVISTAGLNAQARLADEETRSMDNLRWQVGWYVFPS